MTPKNPEIEDLLTKLAEHSQRFGANSIESLNIFEAIVRKYSQQKIRQSISILLWIFVATITFGGALAVILALFGIVIKTL